MKYQSTKTYGHERGLSCAFRQWRADSHCNQLHGYALSFKFTFEADELDDRNWVQDFGALKPLKERLDYFFDHTTAIAEDDPAYNDMVRLEGLGFCNLRVLSAVGCEAFAKIGLTLAEKVVAPGVRVVSCECAEHGANSAISFA